MKNNKCRTCGEYQRCQETHVSWIFFIIGLIATIAIRAVTVLMHVSPLYGKIAWYVGVGGFTVFFIYKFKVMHERSNLITRSKLVKKLHHKEPLSKEDYSLISNVLCGISSNKEKINYFFIFALSAIALLLALYFDFIK